MYIKRYGLIDKKDNNLPIVIGNKLDDIFWFMKNHGIDDEFDLDHYFIARIFIDPDEPYKLKLENMNEVPKW